MEKERDAIAGGIQRCRQISQANGIFATRLCIFYVNILHVYMGMGYKTKGLHRFEN